MKNNILSMFSNQQILDGILADSRFVDFAKKMENELGEEKKRLTARLEEIEAMEQEQRRVVFLSQNGYYIGSILFDKERQIECKVVEIDGDFCFRYAPKTLLGGWSKQVRVFYFFDNFSKKFNIIQA